MSSDYSNPNYRTGEPDRPPSKVGVAVTDIACGLYAHGAIMAALISRQQTGKGVWIDCSLFDSQVRFSILCGSFHTLMDLFLPLRPSKFHFTTGRRAGQYRI